MNCFHSLVSWRTQRRAILESVKQTGRLSSTSFSKAQLTVLINLARSSADNSSSRGIVTILSGATQVLAVSNVRVLSLSMVALRYTAEAYAICDASQNPISWSVGWPAPFNPSRTWVIMTGLTGLILDTNLRHWSSNSSVSWSSQPNTGTERTKIGW